MKLVKKSLFFIIIFYLTGCNPEPILIYNNVANTICIDETYFIDYVEVKNVGVPSQNTLLKISLEERKSGLDSLSLTSNYPGYSRQQTSLLNDTILYFDVIIFSKEDTAKQVAYSFSVKKNDSIKKVRPFVLRP